MRSRGLVVAIAVVLAVLAAVGVIVYTSSVRENATSENTTQIVTSSQDIAANTPLDPLIQSNVFKLTAIPNDAIVPDAVTDLNQLQGQVSSAPIYQNEQIPLDRLSSGPGSNNLGITPGNLAVGLQVDGAGAVNGYVQQGSHVVIYATFNKGQVVTKQSLKFFLNPGQIGKLAAASSQGGSPSLLVMPTDFTFALVPSVKVLAVTNPPADTSTGKPVAGTSSFVLDLSPSDATNVVFATGHSTLYLGLLPPDADKGYSQPGTIGAPYARVVGVNKG
jgi:Flp pilus assembly protein CpaB